MERMSDGVSKGDGSFGYAMPKCEGQPVPYDSGVPHSASGEPRGPMEHWFEVPITKEMAERVVAHLEELPTAPKEVYEFAEMLRSFVAERDW